MTLALGHSSRDGCCEDEMTQPNLPVEGPSAWMRRDVRSEDYLIELSAVCLDEIRRATDEIRAFPLPTILRAPDDFAMPMCRREMARVRRILDHGRRFVIVDRLPMN